MQCNTIGVDLAKNVFELAVANARGQVSERRRLNRAQFQRYFRNHTPSQVVMETCGTAHYWARTLQAQGHSVTLLPAQYVKAYVRRNKTDRQDAGALLEAFRCKDILAVPPKSEAQQAILGLPRIRQVVLAVHTLIEQLPEPLQAALQSVADEVRVLERHAPC